jgi:glycosyltransferase involved in cell wall biosynthesis
MRSGDLKVSFVIPWYGADIPGGAEAECRRTAEQLAHAGFDVDVLTTCVREFLSDWNTNFHEPGTDDVNGITVRRFPVRKRDTASFDRVNAKLMQGLSVTSHEELIYVSESVRSDELCAYMEHQERGRIFLFIPYMFGTTYWGLQVRPEQSFLIPCLHDESYAYMEVFKPVFRACRGMLLHTSAERELASRLFDLPADKLMVVGEGVDCDFISDAGRFRRRFGIIRPFLLYTGRRDAGKNVPQLLEYFEKYVAERPFGDLDLVLMGSGELASPKEAMVGRVHDLGFVDAQDKYDAYAAAIGLCQPSLNESFSLVIMEAWCANTPVLVHGDCAPTREHCIRSNGGLYFASYDEFAGCVDYLINSPHGARRMGMLGHEYVRRNYAWENVVTRLTEALCR